MEEVSSGSDITGQKIYIRGINKRTSYADIFNHFKDQGEIVSIDFSDQSRKGFCWITFQSTSDVHRIAKTLNQSKLNGTILDIRVDYGKKTQKALNTSVQRSVRHISTDGYAKLTKDSFYYSAAGVVVNDTEYPIPQGKYLTKLLSLAHSSQQNQVKQPLIDIIIEQNNSTKEITESMAMVNAMWMIESLLGFRLCDIFSPIVYVLGDGIRPSTAATLALYLPDSWRYTSIDPLLDLDPERLGAFSSRITLLKKFSQDVDISAQETDCKDGLRPYSFVIACHSHAPLQEFWDRVPSPKVAIAMPCCGKTWSDLNIAPIYVYDDFEVFSPKRTIYVYHHEE